jgi:checkpoint serine/threonine-protein kinase
MDYDWAAIHKKELKQKSTDISSTFQKPSAKDGLAMQSATANVPIETITAGIEENLVLNDENSPPSQVHVEKVSMAKKMRREEKANRTRKIKVMEVRAETQTGIYAETLPIWRRANISSPNEPGFTDGSQIKKEEKCRTDNDIPHQRGNGGDL